MAVHSGKLLVGRASHARIRFHDAAADVRSFYALDQLLKATPGAKAHLEAVSRGVFVLIAAMWEAFCEDLAREAAETLALRARTWEDLPRDLKRRISLDLKADTHELSAWQLAGDSWRTLAVDRVGQIARRTTFNTPKSAQIDALFESAIGLKQVSALWESQRSGAQSPAAALDRAIQIRGAIAHGETPAPSVSKREVSAFYQLAADLAQSTEAVVAALIHESTGYRPWIASAPADGAATGLSNRES